MKNRLFALILLLALTFAFSALGETGEEMVFPAPEFGLSFTISDEQLPLIQGMRYLFTPTALDVNDDGTLRYSSFSMFWLDAETAQSTSLSYEAVLEKMLLVYQIDTVLIEEMDQLDYEEGATVDEIGRADNYAFLCVRYPVKNQDNDPALDTMIQDALRIRDWVQISAPITYNMGEMQNAPGLNMPAVFSAKDLKGDTVTEAVFAQSELTMVSIWATYCSSCIDQMPDLGQVSGSYAPERFQILGIISDSLSFDGEPDEEIVSLAQEITEKKGGSFTHIIPDRAITTELLYNIQYVPTALFLDAKGQLVGEPVIGQKSRDNWVKTIEERLALLKP